MRKIYLLFVLISITAFSQPLSGTYVIGASQTAPFNTLTNAVNKINAVGMSGAVVFLLNDSNYNNETGETFPIAINQINGSSVQNTFTIKPNAGKTVLIQANNSNAWTSTQSVFKFNGADFVSINGSNSNTNSKNLTVTLNNTLEYSKRSVFFFANATDANGANNNTISNLYIEQKNTAGDLSMGIYAGGTAVDGNAATAAHSNNTIQNVAFTKVGQGIYINGNTAANSLSENWKIDASVFGAAADANKAFLGIYLNNIKNYTISNNTIDGLLKNTTNYNPLHAAVYAAGTSTDGKIFNNKISNIRETTGSAGSYGMYLNSNNTTVYNNMILNVRANGNGGLNNNGYGIYINNGQNIALYHNTIVLKENQSSGFSAAVCINAGSNFSVVNNILANNQTSGATRYAIYSSVAASAFTTINFNDYYSAQHMGYLGGNRTALANWKSATSQDLKSVNILPTFVSATDLHIAPESNADFDNLGTPIATVTSDIDLESRSTTKPDLGADEFEAAKCATSTTWNGTAWSNGLPNSTVKAILNGNYNTGLGNFTTCELVVNTGFVLTVNSNDYIVVQNDIVIKGDVVVENNGSFVQVSDDAKSSDSVTGTFTMKRTTSPIKAYDFVFWTSPVQQQTLYNLSPNTRFDKFYKFDASINNWVVIQNGVGTMEDARGYIVRAPATYSQSIAANYDATFVGKPNNGLITTPIVKTSANSMNLVGNPYPSAIDAAKFLNDPVNAGKVDGTIYLWSHATAISASNPGTAQYNFSSDDYIAYNKVGGLSTQKTGKPFDGKIAAGQAFFLNATVASGVATFSNTMRVKTGNDQFYKQSTDPLSESASQNASGRLWFDLSNEQGAFKQTLIGYVAGATNGIDRSFDGEAISANSFVNFYSIAENKNLIIQGRALPFTDTEVVPMGFSTTLAGTFTISLSKFDGLFGNQQVYLVDKLLHTVTGIKSDGYTFTTAAGTFNDRFEIKFTNAVLGTHEVAIATNDVIIAAKDGQIMVRSSEIIDTIAVYDLNGKQIVTKKVNALNTTIEDLRMSQQVFLVQLTFENSAVLTKQVLLD